MLRALFEHILDLLHKSCTFRKKLCFLIPNIFFHVILCICIQRRRQEFALEFFFDELTRICEGGS